MVVPCSGSVGATRAAWLGGLPDDAREGTTMKFTLIGIDPEWSVQAISGLCAESGISVPVAKAVIDELTASGRIDVPAAGVEASRLQEGLDPFGIRVAGPLPSPDPITWPEVVDLGINLGEFNALVERHVPELLEAVRDMQAQTADLDGVRLRPDLTDPTIVHNPLVFSVLPAFIKAATHPVNPDALTRFNNFLMELEARQPGMAARNLMPMWLRADLDDTPESLSYFDPVLLEQEADIF